MREFQDSISAGSCTKPLRVGRMDVFSHPDVPERYKIKGIPQLILFKGGEPVFERAGDHSLERLRELLADAL